MLRTIITLLIGIIVGAFLMAFYIKEKDSSVQTDYIELKGDFKLPGGSILRKGILLRSDKSMNEGFTRYILYINYKGTAFIKHNAFEKENFVKPYWMFLDTLMEK